MIFSEFEKREISLRKRDLNILACMGHISIIHVVVETAATLAGG